MKPAPTLGTGGTKNITDLGKLLIAIGLIFVVAGAALTILGRTHLPLGRLPGDIVYRGRNTAFYFPLATSLLLSVILSTVLYVIQRWRR
jgi:hypothetical protein